MSPPVFLVDALPAGSTAVLAGPEGRHAAVVRRIQPGERIELSDGGGGIAECVVTAVDGHTLRLEVSDRRVIAEPTPRVVLAQALLKGDRGELAVELATEAGVDEIVPWRARRCVVRWDDGPRGARALARWRSTAREAGKQSRRARVPVIGEPVDSRGLCALVAGAERALLLHESTSIGLREVELPSAGRLLIVVGPEGGIEDGELAMLTGAGARPVRLGPDVLRASTAAAVALGAIGVLTPRWS